MKNIHVLPTDKPSRIHFYSNVTFGVSKEHLNWKQGRNIYITSDEVIKDGNYIMNKHGQISKCVKALEEWLKVNKSDIRKIILTTDQDLINDGVQAIDDEFLQWFVKNPSCESVKVEKRYSDFTVDPFVGYKIIIPQEKAKQETLENELWCNVFAKIKQYVLNYELLTVLKPNFNISKR
jgi:hypothetical protein